MFHPASSYQSSFLLPTAGLDSIPFTFAVPAIILAASDCIVPENS